MFVFKRPSAAVLVPLALLVAVVIASRMDTRPIAGQAAQTVAASLPSK